MLMAYEDLGGFTIKDTPTEENRVPLRPIKDRAEAQRILARARTDRPDIVWSLVGNGPYGVHGTPR
jgi:hypothetical protein